MPSSRHPDIEYKRLSRVVTMRENGATYKNIGMDTGGITGERARQLYKKAKRRYIISRSIYECIAR